MKMIACIILSIFKAYLFYFVLHRIELYIYSLVKISELEIMR
jgi:hypothetical protein